MKLPLKAFYPIFWDNKKERRALGMSKDFTKGFKQGARIVSLLLPNDLIGITIKIAFVLLTV